MNIKNLTNEEKLKKINSLALDIDCLEPLHEWTNDINIFNILKLDRAEIRHSNMLSWLLDPNGTHGLGDKLLKKILINAINIADLEIFKKLSPVEIDILDLYDSIILRENNYIDLLIVSEKSKLVCAIENKIGTTEHSDQLRRYREYLLKEYGSDYRYVLIYLTPELSQVSSDTNFWVSMNYQFILEELTKLISIYKLPDKSKIFIADYIKVIRSKIVEDKELKEICFKIYKKHQEAFDIIFENIPNGLGAISQFIYEYLVKNRERFDINVWDDYSKTLVRFTPNKLAKIYGKMGNGMWCGSTQLLGFEFQNYENSNLALKVIVGPVQEEFLENKQKLLDLAIKNKWRRNGDSVGQWQTLKSDVILLKDKRSEFKTEILNEGTKEIIATTIDNYMQNKLPEIIEALYINE